jgi:hypothetical protein
MRWQVIAVSAMVGAALAAPCSADLIINGGFESFGDLSVNNLSTGGYGALALTQVGATTTYASTTALPGWTVARTGDVQFGWLMNGNYSGASPQAGTYDLNFADSSSAPETISQSIAVSVGNAYTVSYWEKYRGAGATLQAVADATGGELTLGASTGSAPTGSGSTSLTQTTLGTDSSWTNYTFSFTPSQNTTVALTFHTGTFSDPGSYLDNVSVTATAVPEPSTLTCAIAGLVGLLAYAWRKKR